MWTQWEEGEEGTNWEIRTAVDTLPCVRQPASGNLLCDTGKAAPGLFDDLEGWDAEGGEAQEGRGHMNTQG